MFGTLRDDWVYAWLPKIVGDGTSGQRAVPRFGIAFLIAKLKTKN